MGKTSLVSKTAVRYCLGNFWKHLGYFLFQHLVTLKSTLPFSPILCHHKWRLWLQFSTKRVEGRKKESLVVSFAIKTALSHLQVKSVWSNLAWKLHNISYHPGNTGTYLVLMYKFNNMLFKEFLWLICSTIRTLRPPINSNSSPSLFRILILSDISLKQLNILFTSHLEWLE